MKYTNKSFSVNVGGRAYADNWERIFSKARVNRVCGCGHEERLHTETGGGCIDSMCPCTGFRPKEV